MSGGFYQREKIQKTYDLSSIISKRRNELICNVLVKCNAMEASGTGFEKIEEAYLSADERHKPYICTESDHFKLVLPDLTYEAGTQDDDIPALEFIPVANGTKHDKACLDTATHQRGQRKRSLLIWVSAIPATCARASWRIWFQPVA